MLGTIKKVFSIAIVFPLLANLSFGKIEDSKVAECAKKMDVIIKDGLKKTGIPGCAFVVARKDKIIHVAAIGQTTLDSKSPTEVTPSTVFPVSSVSKNFTAVLVGALVDAGKLHWNDKVRKYLPDFFISTEELSQEMTITDLISHSSGFNHFYGDSLLAVDYDKAKILRSLRFIKQRPGEFRKRYGYQNIIFGIIGDVLEAATGEKYEDLIQEYIFDKMGMTESSAIRSAYIDSKYGYFKYLLSRFGHDKEKFGFFKAAWRLISLPFTYKPQHVVTGHSSFKGVIEQRPCIGIYHKFPATSGINVSANDLAKWVSMLTNRGTFNGTTIIPANIFEKLTSPVVVAKNLKDDDLTFVKSRYEKDTVSYGIGIFKAVYSDNGKNGRTIFFHMGGIYGAVAFIAISLEDDIGVGMVCNFGGTAHTLFAEYMVHQFLDLCFSYSKIDWVDAELNSRRLFKRKQDYFLKDLSETNPTPAGTHEEYSGKYENEIYGVVTIFSKGDDLMLSDGVMQTKLNHINGDTYTFPSKNMCQNYHDSDECVVFKRDQSMKVESIFVTCFKENHSTFKKVAN
ncbi:MAG: serine hydrolase [Holosporales bacterium]|jgi:CubicO group peptidase (beta-lactamase class C family)|nr:serine hydrolase [Holosporales bacterium]